MTSANELRCSEKCKYVHPIIILLSILNFIDSYVFLDGEYNGDIFKVTKLDLDLEMTLKTTIHYYQSIANKL